MKRADFLTRFLPHFLAIQAGGDYGARYMTRRYLNTEILTIFAQ